MRKILAPLAAATLLLTACSGGAEEAEETGGSGPLASLTVSSTQDGQPPEVEFDTPLDISEPAVKKLSGGDGAEIDPGQTLSLRMTSLNPQDGSTVMETYSAESGDPLVLDESMKNGNPELYDVLESSKVGSHVAYAVPGVEGAEGAQTRAAQLLVFTIESAEKTVPPLERAEGEAVEPAEGLPTVEVTDGVPEISIPDSADKPDELVAQTLIKGDGAVVEPTDTVTAHYVGVAWEDGETFDSSWERGEPSSFKLTQVVKGWTEGLAGQTVGSRVLLVIPPELGYGSSPDHELSDNTLVFVVDILGVS